MDGVVSYRTNQYPLPGKATLYSLLLPGLGQAYNGEFWKIPIYIGGLGAAYYFYNTNEINYQRYRRIYKELTGDDPSAYQGPSGMTADRALYWRNTYRRMRDYSVLAIAGFYLLQVIDANVFAYMHDFNIADDITMSVSPTVLPTDNAYAFTPGGSALGVSLGIRF